MKFRNLFMASVIALAAPSAQAVNFVVDEIIVSAGTTDGSTTANVSTGDTVTIRIVAEVGTTGAGGVVGSGLTAVGSSAYDYSDVVSFVSGTAVDTFFNTFNAGTSAIGGFNNAAAGALSEIGGAVFLLQGVAAPPGVGSTAPFLASENNDFGLGGGLISAGDVHAEIVFQADNDGMTTILIGANGTTDTIATLDGAEAANNASVTVNVPEPASFLAGLFAVGSTLGVAAIRRR